MYIYTSTQIFLCYKATLPRVADHREFQHILITLTVLPYPVPTGVTLIPELTMHN